MSCLTKQTEFGTELSRKVYQSKNDPVVLWPKEICRDFDFDQHLPRTEANFAALSPLSFIERTAEVYPDRLAIVHGPLRQTWAQTYRRCRQLASALQQRGIGKNDTVAVMLPNTRPWLKPTLGCPWRAVLNALNTRLDAEAIAFMLDHGEAKVVIVDPEFAAVMGRALALRQATHPMLIIEVKTICSAPHASPWAAWTMTSSSGR